MKLQACYYKFIQSLSTSALQCGFQLQTKNNKFNVAEIVDAYRNGFFQNYWVTNLKIHNNHRQIEIKLKYND